jgi:hypothetical protein
MPGTVQSPAASLFIPAASSARTVLHARSNASDAAFAVRAFMVLFPSFACRLR